MRSGPVASGGSLQSAQDSCGGTQRDGGSAVSNFNRRGSRSRAGIGLLLAMPMMVIAGIWFASGHRSEGISSPTPGQEASPRMVAVLDLKVGDCFFAPSEGETTQASFGPVTVVWRVPCGRPHRGEVYAIAELHGATYPGGELESYRECEKLRPGYALDDWAIPDNVMPSHIDPDRTGMQSPGRSIAICTFDITGGMTSSLRQDRSRLTPQQLAYLDAEARLLVDAALVPATFVEHAPEAYRAWAGTLLQSGTSAVQVLDSCPWDGKAQQPVADRAGEMRELLQHLRAAQQSADTATLQREVSAAQHSMSSNTKKAAVRASLGLPSVPPTVPGAITLGSPAPTTGAAA
ncbi:hypothetical protein GCM10010440_59650 [Kitasatospora cinereorecta]